MRHSPFDACEKQYAKFCKLLSASGKDISLSGMVDCMDKVVADGGGKRVVTWNIDSKRLVQLAQM